MTDKPILFSGPMVRALLDGRKTQTRRVLKPQPTGAKFKGIFTDTNTAIFGEDGQDVLSRTCEETPIKYAVGDRLWVRESWRVGAWHYNNANIAVDYADGPRKEWLHVENGDMLYRLIDQSREDAKKAGAPLRDSYYEYSWGPGQGPTRWRPSIHMPREFSRLTLTVTDVRVQRLQEISEDDAVAEGFFPTPPHPIKGPKGFSATDNFRSLWNGLNADRNGGAYAWDQNPWVAAYTFTVHKCNIDQMGGAS